MRGDILLSFLTSLYLFIGTAKLQSGGPCVLPSHPENGQWTIINGDARPGEHIQINTVLKFECNEGYKLSTQSPYLFCDNNWKAAVIPECEKLCPPIYSTPTTTLKCIDKNGLEIGCNEATEGSYLTYTCVRFYEAPIGYKKNLLCVDGSWNFPKPICQPVCGKKIDDDAIPLIAGGSVKAPFEYPWVVALYKKEDRRYKNVCGGSIISPRVVLTAAHCVTNEYGDVLPADNYRVGAGKFYSKYDDTRDIHAQFLDVLRIVVNPGYKAEFRRFLGDIALILTKDVFVLSNIVQPICISDVNSIHLHAGSIGVISGWGVTEDRRPSDELRTLEIPYKYETTCNQELPSDWANKYNTIDKICAGFVNKSMSVCRGDSGSGLAFKNSEDGRFYLHGIVSIGPAVRGECNIQQNSLYTKVSFYYEFVDREVNKHTKETCVLPPYPPNGKWTVQNTSKRPGDVVNSNMMLKVSCNQGFVLSSKKSLISCDTSFFDMPSCNLVCPKLNIPSTVQNVKCESRNGDIINCAEASDGDILSYSCAKSYIIPPGNKSILNCENGSWQDQPRCQLYEASTSTTSTSTPIKYNNLQTRVICRYASWKSHQGINPEDFDASLCTHVIYNYIGLWDNGNARVEDDPLDLDSGEKRGLYHRVTDMKKRNKNLKVLLSVGGWGASNASIFSSVASNSGKKGAFVGSVWYFLSTYGFDGLDIDWHYPAESEKENYISLLRELKDSFTQHKWLLTATVRSDPSGTGYDGAQMNNILDWVNVKTFDMYGSWSSYTGQNSALYPSSGEYDWEKQHLNIAAAASNWIKSGISKNKLAISIAFYGRSFTLKDKNQHGLHAPISGPGPGEEGGILRYSEICKNYGNWSSAWDDEQKNPYKYSAESWFGFDNKDSVWIKAAYAKEKGFFGVNVWPIDGDDVHGDCGTKQILLKHVHGGLGNNVNWNEN